MNVASQRLDARTRACIHAARTILPRVLVGRRPADRELQDYFRAHPKLGRRDRGFIYDAVFALFRWWGWVRHCIPDAPHGPPSLSISDVHSPLSDFSDAQWRSGFLAALLCENGPLHETAASWPEATGLASKRILGDEAELQDLGVRCRALFSLLRGHAPVFPSPAAALLPDWVRPHFHPPIPREQAMRWIVRRAPLWLRIRGGAARTVAPDLARLGSATTPVPNLPNAVCVTNPKENTHNLNSFRRGLIEVQDVNSQAVCAVCGARPSQTWWDACAGGGGKTLYLAEILGSKGHILATDLREHALRNLRRRTGRGRFGNIHIRPMDATCPDGLRQVFDGVLVDAPCTGSGTWRRNPDALWRLRPDDLALMPERQFALLSGVAPRVRPGGYLIYATCSLFREENEEVVNRFLAVAPDFHVETFSHPLFENRQCRGMVQIWPWDADGNAMFVARLRRSG